jgi:hypothetical protein
MSILRDQNAMTNSTSLGILMLESEAVESLKLLILPLSLLDKAILSTFTSDAAEKYAPTWSRLCAVWESSHSLVYLVVSPSDGAAFPGISDSLN